MLNAVFLDRDGVLNVEAGHLTDPRQLRLLPGASHAVKRLNGHGVPVIVVTNQSVVGRGRCSEQEIEHIHSALQDLLAQDQASITRFYYCPHHPSEALGIYRLDCECRKPKPGMLRQAAQELSIDLAGSVMVGDNLTDIQAGRSAGCHTVLISTGNGAQNPPGSADRSNRPDHVADGLDSAVDWILQILGASSDTTDSADTEKR